MDEGELKDDMKVLERAVQLGVVACLFLTLTATASEAGGGWHGGGSHHSGGSHGHGRVVVGFGGWWGPGWWGGWPYYPYYGGYYPYYGGYYPYYGYYPYASSYGYSPDPVTYVQREPATQSRPNAFWYYCESARGFYPAVQSCPESWLKVVPRNQ
ncbi:MAG TPA: hypothetical protein VFQ62_03925 [Methylomirabilota bacterium]|nr:hypothetical protein [Methylomirabilota bacterium]